MSLLVVALLSLLWLAFFLPSLLQARRTSSPYASATNFQDSLRRLGEVPQPHPGRTVPAGPAARAAAVKARRRDTLAVLTAAALAGDLIALGFGGWAAWAALPPTAALVAYVVWLRRDAVRRSASRRRWQAPPVPADAPSQAAEPATGEPQPAPLVDDADIVPSVRRRGAVPEAERMAG